MVRSCSPARSGWCAASRRNSCVVRSGAAIAKRRSTYARTTSESRTKNPSTSPRSGRRSCSSRASSSIAHSPAGSSGSGASGARRDISFQTATPPNTTAAAATAHHHGRPPMSTGPRMPDASSVSGMSSPRSEVSVTDAAGILAVRVLPSASVAETSIAGTSRLPASHATRSAASRVSPGAAVPPFTGRTSKAPAVSPRLGMRTDIPAGAVAVIRRVIGSPGCHALASSVRVTRRSPSAACCSTRAWAGARSVARGAFGAGFASVCATAVPPTTSDAQRNTAMHFLIAPSWIRGGGRTPSAVPRSRRRSPRGWLPNASGAACRQATHRPRPRAA